jgi:hypothetical protein
VGPFVLGAAIAECAMAVQVSRVGHLSSDVLLEAPVPNRGFFVPRRRPLHESVDEPDYNDGAQNDHPIGNLNARYRCCPAKPFHDFPPR